MSDFSRPALIISDAALPSDEWLFPEPLVAPPGRIIRPLYGVPETAKFFFGRGSSWLRVNERKAMLDGKPLEEVIGPRDANQRREYTLYDIERMAHAFAESQIITGERLRLALRLLQLQAHVWRYLTEGTI